MPSETLNRLTGMLAEWLYTPIPQPTLLVGMLILLGFICLEAARRGWRYRRSSQLLAVYGVIQFAGALTASSDHAPAFTHFTLISNVTLLLLLHAFTRTRTRK